MWKKLDGAAQCGFVEVIAQVGDQAEAGVVHQVGAEVVADALDDGGEHEREGHHVPCIVQVHEMGNEGAEIESANASGKAEEDGAFGRVGPKDLVEDGLEQERAEGIEHADASEQDDTRKPFEPVGKPEAQKAEESPHAGGHRLDGADLCLVWAPSEYCRRWGETGHYEPVNWQAAVFFA